MKYRRHLPFLLTLLIAATAALWPTRTHAAPQLQIQAPFQVVAVDGVEFGFEADVTLCRNETSRGFGFVELSGGDDVARLVPVWGAVDWRTRAVVLTFVPVIDREIGPDDLVVAVVQQSAAGGNDRLIVDLSWGLAFPLDPPPPFEVEGTISVVPRGDRCERVDYGQLDARLLIDTPLQPVDPLPPSNIIGFEARIGVDRNQAARGFLDVYPARSEPVSYEPFFGAAFPGEDAVVVRAVVILLLADRQAPLNTNDHLLRATVAVERANPECQIWDLINGTTGQVNGTFEALGNIRVEQLNNKYPENLNRR